MIYKFNAYKHGFNKNIICNLSFQQDLSTCMVVSIYDIINIIMDLSIYGIINISQLITQHAQVSRGHASKGSSERVLD